MTVTAASFLAEFPEFSGASVTLVNAKIAAATLRTPASVWGPLQDEGVKYLAAHLLANSPFARELQLTRENGESIYTPERSRLERTAAMGAGRITGGS